MAVGKKLLSAFFSFTLVMGLLPYSAFADPLDSSSDSTESSSDASTSNESEFADGGVASKPDPSDSEGGMDSSGSVSGGEDVEFGVGDEFVNEQEMMASWQFGPTALTTPPTLRMFTRPIPTKLKHTLTALTFSQ